MANNQLVDYYCTTCGKFIIKAMPGAKVRCTNRTSKISSICAGKGEERENNPSTLNNINTDLITASDIDLTLITLAEATNEETSPENKKMKYETALAAAMGLIPPPPAPLETEHVTEGGRKEKTKWGAKKPKKNK